MGGEGGKVSGGLREVSRGWNQLMAFLLGLSCVPAIAEQSMNITCVRATTSLLGRTKEPWRGVEGELRQYLLPGPKYTLNNGVLGAVTQIQPDTISIMAWDRSPAALRWKMAFGRRQ